jgi:hypothetical protein
LAAVECNGALLILSFFSSILYITVYDEDRFGEPEFLGRIAIPVSTIRNRMKIRRIVQLRDKNLRRLTRGTLEVVVEKNWDPWKVSLGFIVIKHFISCS